MNWHGSACGRLLFKCIPEDEKAEFEQAINNDMSWHESILEEVRFKMHQKKFDEALVLMENLIKRIEDLLMFTDDKVSEYHCFNEFFEEALYRQYNHPERDLRQATFHLDEIYLLYGSLLIDLRRIDDARAALETAMHWNPFAFGTLKNGKTRSINPAPFVLKTLKAHKEYQEEQKRMAGDLWNEGKFPNLVFTHEKLKASDQLGWISQMNSIRSQAEEIVLQEIIYS